MTANRGALLFFLMNDLFRIHTFYKYSLSAFLVVVGRAIDMVEEGKLHFDNIDKDNEKETEEEKEEAPKEIEGEGKEGEDAPEKDKKEGEEGEKKEGEEGEEAPEKEEAP